MLIIINRHNKPTGREQSLSPPSQGVTITAPFISFVSLRIFNAVVPSVLRVELILFVIHADDDLVTFAVHPLGVLPA